MQGVARDLIKRGGIRALEAFGDTRARRAAERTARHPYGGCVLPADYLRRVGLQDPPAARRATRGCGSTCARW